MEEIGRLLEVLERSLYQNSADAVRLLLFTGARKSEVLGARWSQFDLRRGIWSKPAHTTKQKREEHIPLSEAALTLLLKMEEGRHEASEYLFPSPQDGLKPVQDLKSFWRSLCEEAGLDNLRIHDLRHTFASHLVQSGVSLPIIGRLLGHTQAQTTERYAHLSDAPLREATNRFLN